MTAQWWIANQGNTTTADGPARSDHDQCLNSLAIGVIGFLCAKNMQLVQNKTKDLLIGNFCDLTVIGEIEIFLYSTVIIRTLITFY